MRMSLEKSVGTGFLDESIESSGDLRPNLVLNDPPRSKVLSTLLKELQWCTSFEFSVAFITTGGLAMLQQALLEAQSRGVEGRILTSDYLTFTEPRALEHLMNQFPSFELKVYSQASFHAKGYLFHHADQGISSLIVGSSNITHGALSTNREWNVRLVSLQEGELLKKTQEEFASAWDRAIEVSPAWLGHYRMLYDSHKRSVQEGFVPVYAEEPAQWPVLGFTEIVPNSMQQEALASLEALRRAGKNKALLISATGTGKTFLSAFDVASQKPQRFLFVVHRQQIAQASMEAFKEILGSDISCGQLGGGYAELDVQYLFSMVQTLSQEEVLHSFAPDHFDYIVVDEVHRSGADSYLKILEYFKPSFLLGMTATPERTDGFDIYRLFDHTIAYEIRLHQALEANLLCPFHYYGISSLDVDGVPFEDLSSFSFLENQAVKVKQMLDRYSIGTYRRRGLIFCSQNEEAKRLSEGLCSLGIKALALSGSDEVEVRNEAFRRLEMEDGEGMLEYLVAVDIFNEGIDIPSLNQVVMIRPTQSAIIFVQQMGRGLRKHPGKEYLTVIDFVANYDNNYMIPIALYGDTSYKKDTLRKFVSGESLSIPGPSTVSFDKIAKERIYASINAASFQKKRFLSEEYMKVKKKLDKVPTMMDFVRLNAISPLLFIDYAKSYFQFKASIGEVEIGSLTPLHLKSLLFFSQILPKGIRPYEGLLVGLLFDQHQGITLEHLQSHVEDRYGFVADEASLLSSIEMLRCGFFSQARCNAFGNLLYCERRGSAIFPTQEFSTLLQNRAYREELVQMLALGEYEYRQHYLEGRGEHDLVLYQKYTRQEVCRLLNWTRDDSSTIYGYRVHKESQTCPIFVTYHKKKETINASTNYPDGFLSRDLLRWTTRNNIKLQGTEPPYIRGEKGPMENLLFVQKSNDEGLAFYYLGQLKFLANEQKTILNDKGKLLPIVEMIFRLPQSVPQDLYSYIIEKGEAEGSGSSSVV